MPPILPAIVTCLALIQYTAFVFNVARARVQYRIKAPATTGHPVFERAYRVQLNTLEHLALFLPSLWLFSLFVSPTWGALLGLVWIAGRGWYAWSYYRDPASRAPGLVISLAVAITLLIGALVGAMLALGRTGVM